MFVQPRTRYGSYADFRSLIAVCGFEQCFIDEMRLNFDGVYIVSPINGEYRPHIDNHRLETKNCKIVMWQLERPGGDRQCDASSTLKDFIVNNKRFINDGYADIIWISDRWMAGVHNDSRIVFAPMGSSPLLHTGLKSWEVETKGFDYLHLSYISYRRQILDALAAVHDMKYAGGGWGEIRAVALRNTKFLVNIHQDVHPMGEPLRIALAGASGVPYISEELCDPYPMVPDVHFVQCRYDDFLSTVALANKNRYERYQAMGMALHNLLCDDYRFDKGVIDRCKSL